MDIDVVSPDGLLDTSVSARLPSHLAAEVLELAAAEPERAVQLAPAAVQRAGATQSWPALSVALRGWGVAAMQLRQLELAVARLHDAVAAAAEAGNAALMGEAEMSLASALVLTGAPAEAYAAIDSALSRLTGLAAARARTQRAAILQEMGHDGRALEDLRIALPMLRRGHDAEWETRALSNRSLLLVGRRQFRAAEADLRRARDLAGAAGLRLPGAYVEQNLGCVAAGRGDVPAALVHFAAAQQLYESLGLEVGSLLVDRAKVLLSVRLVREAREAAEAAAAVFEAQGRRVHIPEALLMASTAALVDGDEAAARTAASAAARAFDDLGRTEWCALARYAELQAELGPASLSTLLRSRTSSDAGRLAAALGACAEDLEAAGWLVPALEARILAGVLALEHGDIEVARTNLRRAGTARRRGPAEVRARAWLGEALLRQAAGSRSGAMSALRAGLRVLDDHRASLSATELRAHISVHRDGLARVGLRLAVTQGQARAALWWAERGRASADSLRPALPPADPALARDLEELRATMVEIEEARGAGAPSAALVRRQVQLERAIRDRARATGARSWVTAAPPRVDDLVDALGPAVLVEFVGSSDRLYAVSIARGRVRLHDLGDPEPVRHALQHLPHALRRLARTQTSARTADAALAVLDHAGQTLDAALLRPMATLVRDAPLVVVPAGWLQSTPWSTLPSCAGRPVAVAPSAGMWLSATRRTAPAQGGIRAIAGPGLPGAAVEAESVAGLYPDGVALTGAGASVAAVSQVMADARLLHVAAHGILRADNPLFSALQLADGPLTVYDLEALPRTPHHVVLAACNAALSQVTAGQELLGLAAALFAEQTATLLAPVVPVPDVETVDLMLSFHRQLRSGSTPAEALATAQLRHASSGERSRATAAGFICLGAGLVRDHTLQG